MKLCKCGRKLILTVVLDWNKKKHWVCEACRKSFWACGCEQATASRTVEKP